MLRPVIMSAFACAVVAGAGAHEPKEPDDKPVPVTREKLLGKWVGPMDVPITLEFGKGKVVVTDTRQKAKVLLWDYAIDPKEHLVVLAPSPFDDFTSRGFATLKVDNSLIVSIAETPPTIPKSVINAVFTRARPRP